MKGRMAQGAGHTNLVGQHLAPEELKEDSTAGVFSLSSLAFVPCHQEMLETFVTGSSSETSLFPSPRVQARTSGTKESDFANQQNFSAVFIRQARGWEGRLWKIV